MKWLLILLISFSVSLPLTACGKKGDPQPPEGEEGKFPRTYPK